MRILGFSILAVIIAIIATVVTFLCIYPPETLATIAAFLVWGFFTAIYSWTG